MSKRNGERTGGKKSGGTLNYQSIAQLNGQRGKGEAHLDFSFIKIVIYFRV